MPNRELKPSPYLLVALLAAFLLLRFLERRFHPDAGALGSKTSVAPEKAPSLEGGSAAGPLSEPPASRVFPSGAGSSPLPAPPPSPPVVPAPPDVSALIKAARRRAELDRKKAGNPAGEGGMVEPAGEGGTGSGSHVVTGPP
jgi:hypothetical protein